MFQETVTQYLQQDHYQSIQLKSVLSDMDDVLFNPMPYHAEAWHKTMEAHRFHLSKEETYLHEGRTEAGAINTVCQCQLGHGVTPEEIESTYHEKSIELNKHSQAEHMPGAWELLQKIKSEGIIPTAVTGSGQASLLDRLEYNFLGVLRRGLMVIAFDVKYGKPNPEPHLVTPEKGGLKPYEAVATENAPPGVEAGHKIGVLTIVVNTGPLDGQVLLNSGADLLFPSMQVLYELWEVLARLLHQPPLKTTTADN